MSMNLQWSLLYLVILLSVVNFLTIFYALPYIKFASQLKEHIKRMAIEDVRNGVFDPFRYGPVFGFFYIYEQNEYQKNKGE